MRIPRGMLGAFGFLLPGPTTRIVQVAALRKLPLQLLALPSSSSTGPSRGRQLDSSPSSSEFQSLSPEEQSKWDQLYQQGEARRNSLGATMESTAVTVPSVRVVTFDLDNTIWNTGATIAAANDALAQFLNRHNIVQSKRTEQIMGELFRADKAKYCPLALPEQLEDIQAPVLLTQLRKDSLQFLLMQDNGYTEGDAQKFASTAFDRWMEARYSAIPSHFASGVSSVLRHISDLKKRPSSLLVGAITDGNSDPRNIPELEPHFDFCINAERVGVSKPDPRVYAKAMECVWERSSSNGGMDPDTWMEEGVAGPWWVHIGDDFTKDIVAAKNLNMRTVWVRELLDNHQKGPPPAVADDKAQALAEEQRLVQFQKKIDGQAVVQMAVGAEDYLATSIQREFADAIIDRFADLSELLHQWHLDGLPPAQPQPQSQSAQPVGRKEPVYVPDEADLVRDLLRDRKATTSTDAPMESGAIMDVPPKASPETPSRGMRGATYVHMPDEADLVRDLLRDRKATSTKDAPMKSGVIMDVPPKTSAEEPSRGMGGAAYVYVPDEADLVRDLLRDRKATSSTDAPMESGVIMDVPPKASPETPFRRMRGAEYVYVPDEADLVRDLLRDRKATSATDPPMESGVIMPKTSPEAPSRGMGGTAYAYVPDEADLVQDWVRRNAAQPNKFCVLCDAKIPMEAAFCSTCGVKQPQMQ